MHTKMMFNFKRSIVTALLSGAALASFAQAPTASTASPSAAHASHKQATPGGKARSVQHKAQSHAKKHPVAHQHASKKSHKRSVSTGHNNANTSGKAGPGLQAY
jgi:hypothetical protein